MATDLERVRLISRGAAAGLAVAALYGASLVRTDAAQGFDGAGAVSIAVVVETIEPERITTRVAIAPASARRGGLAIGEGEVSLPLLWINAPDGRILFRTAEQYHRCVDARRRRANEADCPDAWETRALALASG